jgi:hypothetical protein
MSRVRSIRRRGTFYALREDGGEDPEAHGEKGMKD